LIYDRRWRRHLLFDLTADPGETREIGTERPDRLSELAARLHTWKRVQFEYYQDSSIHTSAYAPILAD